MVFPSELFFLKIDCSIHCSKIYEDKFRIQVSTGHFFGFIYHIYKDDIHIVNIYSDKFKINHQ